jgi:hypothetical protein
LIGHASDFLGTRWQLAHLMAMIRPPWKRSPKETADALIAQRKALASSCAAFDAGDRWEAQRLANAVYILVYDKGAIKSILGQVGIKDSLLFRSSGRVRNNELLGVSPLIGVTLSFNGARYTPILDAPIATDWISFA